MTETSDIVWEGKYLRVTKQGTWEYVSRTRSVTAAVILAIEEGHVLLVEQYRVPLQAKCLELPAGLVGDEQEGEAIELAARRELEEETGYRATEMIDLGRYFSSPGMSSEGFSLYLAKGLTKVSEGGGVEGENITVHRIPLGDVAAFVDAQRRQGIRIDVKILLLIAGHLLPAEG